MPRKFFRKYLPSHAAISSNRHVARFGKLFKHHNLWHIHRRSVAGAVAVGMFAGLIPGSNPVQFTAAALLAVVFHVNLAIAVLVTLYSNPFTVVPLYYLAFKLGQLALLQSGGDFPSFPSDLRTGGVGAWTHAVLDWLTSMGKPLLVGLPLLALLLSVLGYVLITVRLARAHGICMARTPAPSRSDGAAMTAPVYWKQATRELAERDAVIRKIAARARVLEQRSRGDAFNTLARSIVSQQISLKAASSVWQRLIGTVPEFKPHVIHTHDPEALRACGLSRSKVIYLQDLARHFVEERFSVQRWEQMSDEELITELTQVRGIGRWTAEMFLIFYLSRPNVLPLDDVGLQRAMSLHYNHGKPLSKLKINAIGKRWAPWRSVATWYMWRSLEPIPVIY